MCGILGFYSLNNNIAVNRTRFEKALQKIIHRGPDAQLCEFYNEDKVALGHTRLSIIDLSEGGNQPMHIGNYRVVFNGEIYNYIEIREELINFGYKFSTDSDTEVLVNAYDYWGEKCLEKLNGMWAFAVYDFQNDKLFCSRDRFGVKPFNYFLDKDQFIFSSEIKTIVEYDKTLKKPNYNSIGLFCREGICGEIEDTWFESIKRLMPGHNLVIENKKTKIYKYYFYTSKIQNEITFDEAKSKFLEIFTDAVKLRMRSDVPVGTTLSGGLDSSSIVSVLRTFFQGEHNSFTAHFPNFKDNEFESANKTNKYFNLKGNPIEIDYGNEYISILNKIVYHLESGHLSPSVFPLWKIYEKSKEKVTVLLEGQGADEVMGGYISSSSGSFLFESLSKLKLGNFIKQSKLIHKHYGLLNTLILSLRIFSPPPVRALLRRYVLKYEDIFDNNLKKYNYPKKIETKSESSFIKALQDAHQTTLVNLLHYGDAISMAFSLESRLPFMDYRLVDFCFSLPSEYLINDGKGKYILRESLKDILPQHIYNDHKKLGFPSPIDDFFKNNKELIKDILLSERSKHRNLYNYKNLENFIENVGHKNNSERVIFRLICVELWFRNFMD